MRITIAHLLRALNGKKTVCDIDEELQFHLEMLERKFAQTGMSAAEARAAALRRFGNVERVKKQCVNISIRNTLLRRALKTLLIVIALTGVSIRLLALDPNVAHIGDTLIMIAISGRLLLYVRTLTPGSHRSVVSQRRQD